MWMARMGRHLPWVRQIWIVRSATISTKYVDCTMHDLSCLKYQRENLCAPPFRWFQTFNASVVLHGQNMTLLTLSKPKMISSTTHLDVLSRVRNGEPKVNRQSRKTWKESEPARTHTYSVISVLIQKCGHQLIWMNWTKHATSQNCKMSTYQASHKLQFSAKLRSCWLRCVWVHMYCRHKICVVVCVGR